MGGGVKWNQEELSYFYHLTTLSPKECRDTHGFPYTIATSTKRLSERELAAAMLDKFGDRYGNRRYTEKSVHTHRCYAAARTTEDAQSGGSASSQGQSQRHTHLTPADYEPRQDSANRQRDHYNPPSQHQQTNTRPPSGSAHCEPSQDQRHVPPPMPASAINLPSLRSVLQSFPDHYTAGDHDNQYRRWPTRDANARQNFQTAGDPTRPLLEQSMYAIFRGQQGSATRSSYH